MHPSISVVIPTYNSAHFLESAIKSVVHQTYAATEILVIDDGSTDQTELIAEKWASRVSYSAVPHRGVAAARNIGIKAASGDFVAFLDADDIWVRSKLARQVEVLRSTDADVCYTAMYRIGAAGRVLEIMPAPRVERVWTNTVLLTQPSLYLAQTAIVKRDLILAIGGFDESLSVAADYDLVGRLGPGCKYEGVSAPLAYYRMSEYQMHRNTRVFCGDVMRSTSNLLEAGLVSTEMFVQIRRNLYFTVGLSYVRQGSLAAGIRHLGKAQWSIPRLTGAYVLKKLGLTRLHA